MRSIGFGAYDNFQSLQGLQTLGYTPLPANQEQSLGSSIALAIIGGILLSQVVAYISKKTYEDVEGHTSGWKWYDTVLLPSYIVMGIGTFIGFIFG